MFDTSADAAVVSIIDASARAESAAAARRLAAIAELVTRHADGSTDRAHWSCDNWDAIAAEIAAVQNISHGTASGQMYLAVGLRNRLPAVAALLAQGAISLRLASSIAWRTDLVLNPQAQRLIDAVLANDARRYGPLSQAKTAQAIDAIIDRYDPGALRRSRAQARGRDVVITQNENDSSTATLWGSLLATDGAVLDRRLTSMAREVCDDDPRTTAQRRADALGSLAAGGQRLTCACDNDECPARIADPRASAVVIHVVADSIALSAKPDPHTSGQHVPPPITADMSMLDALAPDPEPPPIWLPSGQIVGGGSVPAPQLGRLAAAGATICRVMSFTDVLPETGYRPSARLVNFIRCRDLTCRFPGCDHPAEFCDIDHSIPYPFGSTHPSNLKCLCRKHHLLKTFWSGPNGWRDRQHPDGTVTWTSPSGHTYTTRPGSRLLFPALCLPTGELPSAPTAQPQSDRRGIMMPTRRRTREQDRAHRINAERALNAAHVAERNESPPF